MNRKWSYEEESFLIENYRFMRVGQMARVLKRSRDAVCHVAKILGIQRKSIDDWERRYIVYLYTFQGYSISQIARLLHRCRNRVRQVLLDTGVHERQPRHPMPKYLMPILVQDGGEADRGLQK